MRPAHNRPAHNRAHELSATPYTAHAEIKTQEKGKVPQGICQQQPWVTKPSISPRSPCVASHKYQEVRGIMYVISPPADKFHHSKLPAPFSLSINHATGWEANINLTCCTLTNLIYSFGTRPSPGIRRPQSSDNIFTGLYHLGQHPQLSKPTKYPAVKRYFQNLLRRWIRLLGSGNIFSSASPIQIFPWHRDKRYSSTVTYVFKYLKYWPSD